MEDCLNSKPTYNELVQMYFDIQCIFIWETSGNIEIELRKLRAECKMWNPEGNYSLERFEI